jgi:EAL domain-containing protein (putative c-di-GMP-specific phosphodiesterase class I)/ActR/RegA family two-component response regulator
MSVIKAKSVNNPNRLLIIDDDTGVREFIADVAEEANYDVYHTSCADDFMDACKSFKPSLIFIDLMMPNKDGIEILRSLAECSIQAKICIMSGMDKKVLQTAERLGKQRGLEMCGTILKPVSVLDLENKLNQVFNVSSPLTAAELATAIETQQLVLHYQPKLRLLPDGKNAIDSVEALVRWQHPQKGLLYPDAFIELAEKTGLIAGLTDCVMDLTIAQLKQWLDQGLELSVAVNISPKSITELEMPDKLVSKINKAGLEPKLFIMEITESAVMDNIDLITDILTRIRIKNIALSMDDFGTGFSSLIQLYRLPFSELKIDRSFVLEIEHNEEARIIVKSLVDLAKKLGLRTCAEGVETKVILDYCKEIGCDTVQGYHISKPLPGCELFRFVRTWEN